jgi:hypothetical protein
MEIEARHELLNNEYHKKLEENKKSAEERTAKKRNKRLKKKHKLKKKKITSQNQLLSKEDEKESEESDSESDQSSSCQGPSTLLVERKQLTEEQLPSEPAINLKSNNALEINQTSKLIDESDKNSEMKEKNLF